MRYVYVNTLPMGAKGTGSLEAQLGSARGGCWQLNLGSSEKKLGLITTELVFEPSNSYMFLPAGATGQSIFYMN